MKAKVKQVLNSKPDDDSRPMSDSERNLQEAVQLLTMDLRNQVGVSKAVSSTSSDKSVEASYCDKMADEWHGIPRIELGLEEINPHPAWGNFVPPHCEFEAVSHAGNDVSHEFSVCVQDSGFYSFQVAPPPTFVTHIPINQCQAWRSYLKVEGETKVTVNGMNYGQPCDTDHYLTTAGAETVHTNQRMTSMDTKMHPPNVVQCTSCFGTDVKGTPLLLFLPFIPNITDT